MTTEEVYSAFHGTAAEGKTFYHGHTFAGNPWARRSPWPASGSSTRKRTIERLQPKIVRLSARLTEVAREPNVGDVRQKGLLAGIELVESKTSKAPFPWTDQVGAGVCLQARSSGLLLRPLGDVIVIMPPLSISLDELDWMMDVVVASIRETLAKREITT